MEYWIFIVEANIRNRKNSFKTNIPPIQHSTTPFGAKPPSYGPVSERKLK
jgi:hypothetical protein